MPTLGTFGAASARGFGLTTAGRLVTNIVISSNTANYVLNTAKVTGYKAGATDVTLTINNGVFVSSASTGSYAFTVDNSWTTGDTLIIVNNGTIQGRGGNGGNNIDSSSGSPGSAAGPALLVQRAVSINNLNRIAGGGGGGGSGGGVTIAQKTGTIYRGGGGGGGGLGISTGGTGNYYNDFNRPQPGEDGTLTSAGSGGIVAGGGGSFQGTGGGGGSYGNSGGTGTKGGAAESGPGGPGGAGGAAVVGNSNITWIAFGTRNGSIS
jgi:hypothetical protein